MTTKNISLTDHYSELVDNLVASAKYKNASEVVREGLRLLEQRTTGDSRRVELRQLPKEFPRGKLWLFAFELSFSCVSSTSSSQEPYG